MKKWHTIIIGAGPGGLACAEILAANSIDVLIIERNHNIGPKVCAGGITGSGLLNDLPKKIIERSFYKQHILTRHQKTVICSNTPIVSTVNRKALGQWMLKKALKAGAIVQAGSRVKSIHDNTIVLKSGEQLGFDFLVGADGSSSLVRQHLGIPTAYFGTGIQYTLPKSLTNMEWHLNTSLFGNGYAWIFPHQQSTSAGAYIAKGKISPKELQHRFTDWASKKNIDLSNLKPEAGLINFDYRGWHFDNIFLVGDAAGLASGITGEGIYPAVISGKTVAKTIINDQYTSKAMAQLLLDQKKHWRLATLTAKNRMFCSILMETLVLGLRTRLINFNALEMGIC